MPRTAARITAAEIDSFARRLKDLLSLADEALAVRATIARGIGAVSAPAARPVGRPAGKTVAAPAKKAGRRTRRAGIPSEKVAPLLGSKGLSIGEIADKLGESSKERVFAALDKLRAAKKAKLVGKRFNARWFAA